MMPIRASFYVNAFLAISFFFCLCLAASLFKAFMSLAPIVFAAPLVSPFAVESSPDWPSSIPLRILERDLFFGLLGDSSLKFT